MSHRRMVFILMAYILRASPYILMAYRRIAFILMAYILRAY
jgi:hypothetical protein